MWKKGLWGEIGKQEHSNTVRDKIFGAVKGKEYLCLWTINTEYHEEVLKDSDIHSTFNTINCGIICSHVMLHEHNTTDEWNWS